MQKSINVFPIISTIEKVDPDNKSATYWKKQLDFAVSKKKSLSKLVVDLHQSVSDCKIKAKTLFLSLIHI